MACDFAPDSSDLLSRIHTRIVAYKKDEPVIGMSVRPQRRMSAFRHAVRVNGDGSAQWIERSELVKLVRRDVNIAGDESPEAVLTREPSLLVPVSQPSVPALDLSTYRVRLDRWESGDGPRLTGMREFVKALETLTVPGRAAVVSGDATTYTFLLDESMSKILACVAIDKPTALRAQD